ncbi:MAG TPA: 1-(5-phosphoribosyl)-5-[(5-phosphoribosylamino)methylideneamino]imidazole-4-carboxamide isomerase [Polyangiaceae bacterium]|nr:1-(5-phosphoribosyl)-5-[(5-phosphoribosylamino)methylideneamino]imidazole-4-carboxamide isomerase [Polyangiaceae bacterium]
MEVIPAIDLISGKAVRLKQGRYDQVTTYEDPPEAIAAEWKALSNRLHVVDLEGAKAGRAVQTDTVRRIVAAFGEGVQLGGGIRSFEAVQGVMALGVSRVVLGTAAIRDPALVKRAAETYPGRVVVAVDAKDGFVATDGWLDVSEKRAVDLVREVGKLPIAAVLYTDIQRDGMETGPNVTETARLADETGVPVIASGGVGTLEHLAQLSAASPGIVAAIVGRALHEKRFSLREARSAAKS